MRPPIVSICIEYDEKFPDYSWWDPDGPENKTQINGEVHKILNERGDFEVTLDKHALSVLEHLRKEAAAHDALLAYIARRAGEFDENVPVDSVPFVSVQEITGVLRNFYESYRDSREDLEQ